MQSSKSLFDFTNIICTSSCHHLYHQVVEEKRQLFAHLSSAALKSDALKTVASMQADDPHMTMNIDAQTSLLHPQNYNQQQQHQKVHHISREVGVNTVDDTINYATSKPVSPLIGPNSNNFNTSDSDIINNSNSNNPNFYNSISNSSQVINAMRKLLLSNKLMSDCDHDTNHVLMMNMTRMSDCHDNSDRFCDGIVIDKILSAKVMVDVDGVLRSTAMQLQEEMTQLDGDIGKILCLIMV